MPTRLVLAAGVFAAALAAQALVQLTFGPFDGSYEDASAYVNDLLFLVILVLAVRAADLLERIQGAPRHARTALALGGGLLCVGVTAGMVAGEDPGIFPIVGLPGNVLILAGWVAIGRHAWRRDVLPRPAAIVLVLLWPLTLIGSAAGLALVPAVLFAWLAATADPAAGGSAAGQAVAPPLCG